RPHRRVRPDPFFVPGWWPGDRRGLPPFPTRRSSDLGGDPSKINPLQPVELVVDHSVQVDAFGSQAAFHLNEERDYERNIERYAFLKWGQKAFANFKVVPPNTGIVHQVNLEYLARVVFGSAPDDVRIGESGLPQAYPDTVVGTDSHTPMVNGLGVLGWGVGGIEAEAAMLGQPVSMLIRSEEHTSELQSREKHVCRLLLEKKIK